MDSGMQKRVQWKYIAIYYGLACSLSWALWAPLILGQDGLKLFQIAPPFPVILCMGTAGPLLACYIAHRLQTGNWQAVRLLPPRKFQVLWFLLGPMLILSCFFVVAPALMSKGAPSKWHWHATVLTGILVPMFNYNLFGGPLFEEFGWRGFLQSRLQHILPPWSAALCVGILWAAWHLPLFLVHGWSSASPQDFFLIVMGLSLVIAFGFNASGGSVVIAILMHSAFNSSPRFMEGYLHGVPARERPSPELCIAASFLLVGAVLSIATRGRIASKEDASMHIISVKQETTI